MKLEPWQREFDVALGAVRDAAALAREIREQRSGQPLVKADRSPVTVADFAVQALIADRLARAFPDDALVAEEDASVLRSSAGRGLLESVFDALRPASLQLSSSEVLDAIDRGRGTPGERFWTLDPIDGTQGFIRGDQYVVALALIQQGRIEIGLLGCPQLTDDRQVGVGSIVCAVRNRGAFRASLAGADFAPLGVSSCSDPSKARVLRSFEGEHIDLSTFNKIIELLAVKAPPTLMDSQAKHAVIAAGQADVLIRVPATREFRDTIWDQAAGSLIVEEAGGRVSDLYGIPLDFAAGRRLARNEGVIASNGRIHATVVDAIRHIQTCP
jgi:3'(2'), 5'-bisphosphate nucleotidase